MHDELPQARLFEAKQLPDTWHQPLNDPVWRDTSDHLRDDDPVLGLYMNRRAWALPWWIMKDPHLAPDDTGSVRRTGVARAAWAPIFTRLAWRPAIYGRTMRKGTPHEIFGGFGPAVLRLFPRKSAAIQEVHRA